MSTRATALAPHLLGLYVLLMYGIAYYAVGTAAPSMAREFGVGVSVVFGLISVSLVLTAVLAPRYGRWMDRFGAARVLAIGALLRAGALALMALAPDLWLFVVAFLAVQLFSQLTEYDATFAAAVDVAGDRARVAMSNITLWGGVASTVFWPITTYALEHMAWRQMFLIYAALMAAGCVPIALLVGRLPTQHKARSGSADGPPPDPNPDPPRQASGTFVLLAMAFALGGIAYNLPVLMPPVLEGLGLGASGLIAGMLFGPSQTAGRLFELLFGQRLHPIGVAVVASGMVALSLGVLLFADGLWTAILFAALFGAGAGVGYVVRGSVVLALYGKSNYATWLGRLGSVRLVVSAMTPFTLSLVLEHSGAWSVVAFCMVAAVLSAGCFVALARVTRPAS